MDIETFLIFIILSPWAWVLTKYFIFQDLWSLVFDFCYALVLDGLGYAVMAMYLNNGNEERVAMKRDSVKQNENKDAICPTELQICDVKSIQENSGPGQVEQKIVDGLKMNNGGIYVLETHTNHASSSQENQDSCQVAKDEALEENKKKVSTKGRPRSFQN